MPLSNTAPNIANHAPINTRAVRDVNYVVTANAAAASNTNALNLVQAVPYPVTENVICQVGLTSGNGGNAMNVVLQHTGALADGTVDTGNFANIPQFSAPLGGAAAFSDPTSNVNVLLPPDVKQFIRAQVKVAATTAGTLTLALDF